MALDLKGRLANDLCVQTTAQRKAGVFQQNLWLVCKILESNEKPTDVQVVIFAKMLTAMIVIMANAKKIMCTKHPGMRIIGLDVYVMRGILVRHGLIHIIRILNDIFFLHLIHHTPVSIQDMTAVSGRVLWATIR